MDEDVKLNLDTGCVEDDRELLVLGLGAVRIEIRASATDMRWLRPLFTANAEPFKALRDLGYMPR